MGISSGEDAGSYHRSHWNNPEFFGKLFLELFTAVGLISIAANILIIFVILKFKKLRQDATNIIIVHMGVLQAIFLFITPLTMRIFLYYFMSDVMFFVLTQIEFFILVVIGLLIVLLIFGSFFKLYYKDTYVKFCRFYKYLIVIFYVGGILSTAGLSLVCSRSSSDFTWVSLNMYIGVLSFILFVIFLIIMNIIHQVKKRRLRETKNNTGLCIANIFIGLWLPVFVSAILLITTEQPAVITVLLTILAMSSPIFNLLYLMLFDGNFKVCIKKVFKCQCADNDYSNNKLDQTVALRNETGVDI